MLPLARLANGPTSRWERVRGLELGDEHLDLELPAGPEPM